MWGSSFITAVTIFIIIIIVSILASGIRIIQPYQQGLWIVLGRYKGKLNPGLNWVYPLVSQVIKMDLRTQVLDVPRQDVITKDNSPVSVDAIIYIRVVDAEKAFFQVANYKLATVALAQTTLRSVIGDMELDEILYNREAINMRLRDILDEATDKWGVKVEAVEIREVEPAPRVKQAMEIQTAAEREKRANILKAEGERRSKILVAEGEKMARILQAEGVRQAYILEAEGKRVAKILEAQGEAQALRILTLGASLMDKKTLAVRTLDAFAQLANTPSTKIILPFELSKLVENFAYYVQKTTKVPEVKEESYEKLEKLVGKPEVVLGPLPSPEEIKEIKEAPKKAEKETIPKDIVKELKEKQEEGK